MPSNNEPNPDPRLDTRTAHSPQSADAGAVNDVTTVSGGERSEDVEATRVKPVANETVRLDGMPSVAGYELTGEIARGGMGVVYRARDLSLDREVAVKVMLPGMNAAEFVRESRITARLPHPGIPPVHALGTLGDTRPFLAMKLIQGETLDTLLRARTDTTADRGRFLVAFEQVCQAVGYAHSQGIVHRDLKPSNVMVGAFGEVQVMDWGLAKEIGVHEPEVTGTGTRSISPDVAATVAGQIKGTPAYMAPEQARGELVDARADVFALGGIQAAILTGCAPFGGTSVLDTIIRAAKAQLDDVFARLDSCEADPELVALAKRCLAARAAHRPESGQAVAEGVAAYRVGVDARVRQAEQDRAAAEAKAEEEHNTRREAEARAEAERLKAAEQRKRRRVQLILVGVVAVALAGAGIATALVVEQRAEDKLAAEQKQSEDRAAADKRLAEEQLAAEKRLGNERLTADQKWQADLKAADDVARAKQRQTRADALLQALSTADTASVKRLIDDLAEYRDLTGSALRELAKQPENTKPGLHARLALLVDEPQRVNELAKYVLVCKPEELLTIREFLTAHSTTVSPGLWAILTDPKAETQRRVHAACTLAGFKGRLTLGDVRWPSVAPTVAQAVAKGNPVEFVVWSRALEPVSHALVPELMKQYLAVRLEIRGGKLDESALAAAVSVYDLTANVLAQYTKDRPADLAELAVIADPRHYKEFTGALQSNRAEVVTALKGEMGKSTSVDWKDAPLKPEWQAVAPDTAKKIEVGQGLLHERFGFVQAVPLAEFEGLALELGKSGYRPTRVRPYVADGKVLVAAVWTRDGVLWKFASGLTAHTARVKDEELRKEGFEPVDVAGWVDPGGKPSPVDAFVAVGGGGGGVGASWVPELRFAVVWRLAPSGKPLSGLYVAGMGTSGHREGFAEYQKAKLWPKAVQVVGVPGAGSWYSGVWGDAPEGANLTWNVTAANYLDGKPNQVPVDVAFYPNGLRAESYAGVWHGQRAVEVDQPIGLSVGEQLAKSKELAASGWRPVSVGVADGKLACSVWHRPQVADAVLEAQAKRKGYSAAALVALGEGSSVWPMFAFPQDGDPTARSYLLQRLAQIGADPQTLMTRFEAEENLSAKRALLIALGDFPLGLVPVVEREALTAKLLVLYQEHPDPGLHGAIDWLLRQKWDKANEIASIDAKLSKQARAKVLAREFLNVGLSLFGVEPLLSDPVVMPGKDWFVNSEGQTFAVVHGPVDFKLGSPLSEPGRTEGDEHQHPKRISRTFAIATKEVTVEQFLRFRPKHDWIKRFSPGPDTPAVAMTWYQAAEYCNWLSEREGIPPDQWCYEPNKEGKYDEGMRMKVGHLKLTGYRLPTESEWEFACRGGAITSRYHGRGEELLPRYGWFVKNAEDRAWPVGQLRPNELGLFDMLGNAMEWCEDPGFYYVTSQREDIESTKNLLIDERLNRLLRGGSFDGRPVVLRSAFRLVNRPGLRFDTVGFRPTRTLP